MLRPHWRRACAGALAVTAVAGCQSSPLAFDSGAHYAQDDRRRAEAAAPTGPAAPRRIAGRTLPVLDDSATLEDYLRYAALNNPGLEAKFQEWRAAVARLPQVRALPDPRFTYGYYIGEIETRVGPAQHYLALSQTFPWFGTLRDREDAAAKAADAAHQRLEAARLALYFEVEQAHNELYYLRRSIEITRENIELLQRFEEVARARYRVAAASHPDLIRIQVELGKLEDRLRRLEDLREPHAARLNAALNRPSDAALPWPAALEEGVVEEDVASLLERLRAQNPDLIALAEEIERERINTELARKAGLPDLTFGLGYTIIGERVDANLDEEGDDALLATLSFSVPLWRAKYDAGVRESVARRLAAASRRQDRTNRLEADLQEALFDHEDAQRRIALYRDTLIPKSTESLQASLTGFEQGTTDFLDLIDTERTLLEFQLALERALADRATSYARIRQLVGSPAIESPDGGSAGEAES